MARKNVNRSELVREELRKNPDASANEVKETMKSKGHAITAGLFYAVKSSMKLNGKRKKAKPQAAKVSLDALREVRAVADRVGGMDALIEVARAMQ